MLTEILTGSKYTIINNNIERKIGKTASGILSALIGCYDCFVKFGVIKAGEKFYRSVSDLEADTQLSKFKQSCAIKTLIKEKLISTATERNPLPTRFFWFTEENISNIKNMAEYSEKKETPQNENFFCGDRSNNLTQQVKKLNSASQKTEHKSIINNSKNNINVIQAKQEFLSNIDMDRLTAEHKEFSELLLTVINPVFENEFSRVNMRNVHISVIVEKFRKLTFDHIMRAKYKISEFKNNIKNVKSYLLTVLFDIADIPEKLLKHYSRIDMEKFGKSIAESDDDVIILSKEEKPCKIENDVTLQKEEKNTETLPKEEKPFIPENVKGNMPFNIEEMHRKMEEMRKKYDEEINTVKTIEPTPENLREILSELPEKENPAQWIKDVCPDWIKCPDKSISDMIDIIIRKCSDVPDYSYLF